VIGEDRRLTVRITTARIMEAMITKAAPLKRPISVILRRRPILTVHKSWIVSNDVTGSVEILTYRQWNREEV